jgi:glycosyltransferase involved in cell wall biosynthesis
VSRVRASLAHQYYLRQERAAIRTARHIVCNSRSTAEHVVHAYGPPADRVKVVYYGSDASAFSPITPEERCRSRRQLGWPETRPTVVFIGALGDRRKGFDRLFEAWQLLSAGADWDVNLVVAGSGRELPRWQSRARESGVSSVHFLGFRDDIATVIAASDAVVHPARYEAYGLGVHEALSRGLPAIVSARAGVAERIDGPLRSLLIDDVESAAEIADRLRRWRGAADAYRSAAAVVGDRLRTHTWDDMVADFVKAVA